MACTPDEDQIPGAVRDYFPIQRWIGVSDGERGVVIAPLEAPLVQLGGITSARWADRLEPEGPTIMSWPMNNHWEVNFKASQDGEVPLTYHLTTHAGPTNDTVAARFAAEQAVPPIVLRDRVRTGAPQGRFLDIPMDSEVLVTAKPAEDSKAIILRFQNLKAEDQIVPVRFLSETLTSAAQVSPIETETGEAIPIDASTITVTLRPLAVMTVKVNLA